MIDNCMLNWGDRQNKIFNINEIQTSKLKQVNLYIYIYIYKLVSISKSGLLLEFSHPKFKLVVVGCFNEVLGHNKL